MPDRRVCPHCGQRRWIPLAYEPYCTRTCLRDGQPVTCCVCGAQYRPGHPAVQYRSLDRKWWCADEQACTARARAAAAPSAPLAVMYAEIDAAWERIIKEGWTL